MQASTYNAINPSAWKLGNVFTTPKGLKKIDVQTEDGTKPVFQLWKAGDAYLRAPYGISEPFNAGGESGNPSSGMPVTVKAMPLELKHQDHFNFCQLLDNAVLQLIFNSQRRLFDLAAEDELIPLSMLRRQFCGIVKLSKKPEYPATARIKVNVGKAESATSFLKFEQRQTHNCSCEDVLRGCTVIPIVEFQGIWMSSTGGFGVTLQATQVLIMTQGSAQSVGFAGLEFINQDE